MSIRAICEDGVFKPLEAVNGATHGKLYMVFSQDELWDLRETTEWLRAADPVFKFWDNDEDAVYDTL